MQALNRIAVIDSDHVLRLLELSLDGSEGDLLECGRNLLGSPDFNPSRLRSLVRSLRECGDFEVIHPGEDFRRAEIIITRRGILGSKEIDACQNLKLIQNFGKNLSRIDISAAHARGIGVAAVPRVSLQYTAEHAILLMMALVKHLLPSDRAVREGRHRGSVVPTQGANVPRWAGIEGARGLYGLTLGLIGLGEVGLLVNDLARAFGMRVVYTRPERYRLDVERSLSVTFCSLPDLMAQADVISVHVACCRFCGHEVKLI